jgi:hypothetical protein
MAINDLRRLHAGAVAGLLMASAAVAAAAPSPSPTPARGSTVALVPIASSPHLTGSGQALDFGRVRPGATVRDTLLVRNVGSTPTTVVVYPADAYSAAGGGLGFGLRTDPRTQMGAWIKLARSTVTVPGGGFVPLAFTVTLPKVVQGGGYAGGVVAEQSTPPAAAGGLTQVYRFAVPIYLEVPGGVPGATPGRGRPGGMVEVVDVTFPVRGGKVCPTVSYRNNSQQIANPDATVRIKPRWVGSAKTHVYKGIGTILPDAGVTTSLPCQTLPATGGHVDVSLSGPHVNADHAQRGTDIERSLWPVLIALLLLVLLLALLLWFLLRRRGRDDDEAAQSA